MTRVAILGFLHETNTFSSVPAELNNFIEPDAWPGLLEGESLAGNVKGKNLPVAGFIEAAQADWELVPLLWCSCSPCGPVTEAAYEEIVEKILTYIKNDGPFDALYMDLHGAMVVEHADDGEGELLRRIRTIVGNDVVIVCSLDFHANISAGMLAKADSIAVYRTYPHVDMADTGERCVELMVRALQEPPPVMLWHKFNRPIAMTDQYTGADPLCSFMNWLGTVDEGISHVEFAPGFPLADIADCGPTLVVYGKTGKEAKNLLAQALERIEPFCARPMAKLYTIEEALEHYERPACGKTVIFADVQDNPGCGGTGDTVGVLRVLIERQMQDCVVGVICDPICAMLAHKAGEGAMVQLALGAKNKGFEEEPLEAEFRVEKLTSGRFVGTGSFYRGCDFDLGPMVCLRIDGIQIVVSSKPQQAADQAMFRYVGIEPQEHALLVLKSAVHFRADFSEIASEVVLVKSPGNALADPADVNFIKAFKG